MSFEACETMVREGDPDRFFSALFAPKEKRGGLFALYAFNIELARIGETIKEPMLGQIRHAWWRETVEQARAGAPRAHPVAAALYALLKEKDLPPALFDQMIGARDKDVGAVEIASLEELESYCAGVGGALAELALLWLDGKDREAARAAGTAFALTGVLRNRSFHERVGKQYLPHGVTAPAFNARVWEHYTRARRAKPGKAIAALLPAALVPLYLKNPEREVPLHKRQWKFLSAAMRGKV